MQIYELSSAGGLQTICSDTIPILTGSTSICGLKFLNETPYCLLVGSTNGLVRLFDLRSQKEEARFDYKATEEAGGNTNTPIEEINCFDVNCNSRVMATGTSQYQNQVYLIFHDIRQRQQMGGYFDSHQDDITTIKFHKQNPDLMCSGSVDGLINIFDLKENNEEDALQNTLNTESSVHRINWYIYLYIFIFLIKNIISWQAFEFQKPRFNILHYTYP